MLSPRFRSNHATDPTSEPHVRVTTALNKMLSIPGASVTSVEFTPEGVLVGLRRRRHRTRPNSPLPGGVAAAQAGPDASPRSARAWACPRDPRQ